jgi:hypothetical protein
MECKDKFLMLTKAQKKSGRVYLTEGQLGFLSSLAKGKDVEIIGSPSVPDLSPPSQLQELKAYDDSKELFEFGFGMPILVAYKIISYCKQNKVVYRDFFEELLTHSPANKMIPDSTTTIREQINQLSRHRNKNLTMAKIGLITTAEADTMIGQGRGAALRGVYKKMLKSTRVGSLHYFNPSDVEKFAKTIKKRV